MSGRRRRGPEAEIQRALDACAEQGLTLVARHEASVRRALAGCIEQGFSVAIEDPATLGFLADVFSRAAPTTTERASPHKT